MGVIRRLAQTARPLLQPDRRILEAILGFAEAVLDTTDRLAAGVTEMRELESRKKQLQSELAMATHRRQELEVATVAEHRRLVRMLQGHFTLYSDRLREFGLRPRTKSARKPAAPAPARPKPTLEVPTAVETAA